MAHVIVGLVLGFMARHMGEIIIMALVYGAVKCLIQAIFQKPMVDAIVMETAMTHGSQDVRRNYFIWLFLMSAIVAGAIGGLVLALR